MCQLLTRNCLNILYKLQPGKAGSRLIYTFQDHENLCLYQDYISFVKNQKSITMLSHVHKNNSSTGLISTQELTVVVKPYSSNNMKIEVVFSDVAIFFFISNC